MLLIITHCQQLGRISCGNCANYHRGSCSYGREPGSAGACLRWEPEFWCNFDRTPYPCEQTDSELEDNQLWGFLDCQGCLRCPASQPNC